MRFHKPGAVLALVLAMADGVAVAQAPQTPPDNVYPNPNTTPGEIIEPPGMAPKPLPKPPTTAQSPKEPEQGPVKLEVGAIVIGSDDKNVGRVTKIAAETDGWVREIHVKIDGVSGASGKVVVVRAGGFGRGKDGIRLNVPSSAAAMLPEVTGEPG
ncbi:MAG: hypothetical protein ABL901_06655 [Hyphomicrobiaceae bacterium]